jgi:TonB family protein
MRALWFVALFVGLGTGFSGGQQAVPSALPKPDSQPARIKVYALGPGVTAPELFPLNVTDISTEKCKRKMDGRVVLSVLVDEKGQPRNLMFLHPLGTDLDKFALQIAAADRFKPGMHEGAPVVVGESLEVDMQSCVVEKKNDAGKKTYLLQLRSKPVQKLGDLPQPPEKVVLASGNAGITHVGGSVTTPVPLNNVEAEFSDEARREKYQGTCLISLIVDAHGMPQNVRVVKPLKYGMSEKAIEAVNKYRFKPAMKNGEPVPVMVNVEVNFHLY